MTLRPHEKAAKSMLYSVASLQKTNESLSVVSYDIRHVSVDAEVSEDILV